LRAVARAWGLGGRTGFEANEKEEILADAARFNASEEAFNALETAIETRGSDQVEIWPQNAAAVAAFFAVASQSRFLAVLQGDGSQKLVFIGLDYSGAESGLRLAGLNITPEDWAGVRIMEDEARRVLNGD
jgi:hypothetical protein